MGTQVVGTSKALGAKIALEGCRVLLDAFDIPIIRGHGLVFGIRKPEDVFAVWQ
jgi:hypothetical protein